jgi:hypothetical protein
MESNILLRGYCIITVYILYSLVNQNIYYLKSVMNLVINITPINFLILMNLLFIFYVIFKIKIRINFDISFN